MKSVLFIYLILSTVVLAPAQNFTRTVGHKNFETTNHLGNVVTTTVDKKAVGQHTNTGLVIFYDADVLSYTDYYPYGVLLEGRNNSEAYRYGFQGQEQDDEIKGAGNAVNYTYRMHDPRIGRFFAMDPLSEKYAHYSSYQFSGNKLINSVELEGLEEINVSTKFSIFLSGGFSLSVGVGVQEVTKNTMIAMNSSLTYKRGGPGTSMLSKNLLTYAQSASYTLGIGTGEALNLNLFTDNSASGITNNYFSSFTLGGTMVFSASQHTGLNNAVQWLGGAAIRYSGLQIASYNDTNRFPFFGSGEDQYNSAGLNAQIINQGNLLKFYFDLYYGASNADASYDEDVIVGDTNYDDQSYFDLLLNNGIMNMSFTNSNGEVLSSGYELGYRTFVPTSNAMHNLLNSYSMFNQGQFHFHHLFVPYGSDGKLSGDRLMQYNEGFKRFLFKVDQYYIDKNKKNE